MCLPSQEFLGIQLRMALGKLPLGLWACDRCDHRWAGALLAHLSYVSVLAEAALSVYCTIQKLWRSLGQKLTKKGVVVSAIFDDTWRCFFEIKQLDSLALCKEIIFHASVWTIVNEATFKGMSEQNYLNLGMLAVLHSWWCLDFSQIALDGQRIVPLRVKLHREWQEEGLNIIGLLCFRVEK